MDTQWLGLQDRTVVVTGANGGIGAVITRAFLDCGARVAMLDRNTLDEQGIRAIAGDHAPRCMSIACDVSDDQEVSAAAAAVLAGLGQCAVLVNNAALSLPEPLETIDSEHWSRLMDVNVTGYLRCAKAFGAGMRQCGDGTIVHVASISGSHPRAFGGAYSAAKSAVLMLSRQLAFEWGPNGVRSNCVSPGLVRTPMSEGFYAHEQSRRRREQVVPLRRIGTPQHIADAVTFLASSRASYINGADLVVDGGFTQTLMSHIPRAD